MFQAQEVSQSDANFEVTVSEWRVVVVNKLFISRSVEHDYIIFRHRDLGFQSVSRLPRERYNHLHTSPQPCFVQCACYTDDTISGAHISDSHYHCEYVQSEA